MNKLSAIIAAALLGLSGCQDADIAEQSGEPPVRGLKTVLVEGQERTTVRRYPSVLQPAEITTLSFETAGKLGQIDLKVGQIVARDETLAELDRRSLEIQFESAQSALAQAESNARNAKESFGRQEKLFEDGITTKASLDQARTGMETTAAQVEQAEKQVESALENLDKSVLTAPFEAIVNSVEADSFANIAAGTPVATIYSPVGFEASFSVSYDVINRLAVGKPAAIRLADNPDISLQGVVSELGSRADTVSSFPISVTLNEMRPELKAGMAVEVAMEFTVPQGEGFTLPLSVLPMSGVLDRPESPNDPGETFVFVLDETENVVRRREIMIGGVRGNEIIAIDGLEAGERVASAGVSFLRDGQKVKPLPDGR